jgi:hypothetical protein
MMADNPDVSRFADLLERRFSEMANDALAELESVFTPNGFI